MAMWFESPDCRRTTISRSCPLLSSYRKGFLSPCPKRAWLRVRLACRPQACRWRRPPCRRGTPANDDSARRQISADAHLNPRLRRARKPAPCASPARCSSPQKSSPHPGDGCPRCRAPPQCSSPPCRSLPRQPQTPPPAAAAWPRADDEDRRREHANPPPRRSHCKRAAQEPQPLGQDRDWQQWPERLLALICLPTAWPASYRARRAHVAAQQSDCAEASPQGEAVGRAFAQAEDEAEPAWRKFSRAITWARCRPRGSASQQAPHEDEGRGSPNTYNTPARPHAGEECGHRRPQGQRKKDQEPPLGN